MADQVASVEIQAKATGLAAKLREIRSQFAKLADGVATSFGGRFGSLFTGKKGGLLGKGSFFGDASRTAAGNIMSGVASRGADFFTDIGKDVFAFNDQIERLRIQSESTPEVMAAFAKSIRQTSDATGIGKTKILGAAAAYVTLTGHVDEAIDQSNTFAKVAKATGSNADEIAQTAAALRQNLQVDPKDFEAAFSALTIQGKKGAIELKDMAAELSTIAPQWAQFSKGTGLQGLRSLGAAMQIVKRGFGGDAAETTTGLSNFLTAVTKKASRFREGVGSFFEPGPGGVKRMKDVFTIVDQISKSKLAKDPTALTKAFGSIEAYRAYIQLRDNRKEMDGLVVAASDAGVIQRDFNDYMTTGAARAARSWEGLKNKIADAFTPERIDAFIGKLESLADKLGAIGKILGFGSDVLGGIEKAGEDIRGMITGENRITFYDRAAAKAGDPSAIAKIENIKASASYAAIRAASSPLARKKLGINVESPEQLAFLYSQAQGPGAVAKQAAAKKFYAEQGITPPDVLFKQLLDELRKITANTAAGTEVKVGADPVAKAAKDAPSNRRKVAK